MQRGRGGRDDLFGFGDPFAGFGGFGRPGSLISSFFGGRDPFDDPFFTNPMGSMFGASGIIGSSMFGASGMVGPSMFGPSMFGAPFGHPENAGFLENHPPEPNRSRGPIIQELNSDDEEEGKEGSNAANGKKENNRKRNDTEPYVNEPDDDFEDKRRKSVQYARNFSSSSSNTQSQPLMYSFQSSNVTYSGPNGAYYTASTTRKTGGDGVTFEESKEADTTTGKATHRVSKGLRNKGHSVTRKLNSDGRVDTMQMLHNLNEEELSGFDEAWKGNAKRHLPGWRETPQMLEHGNSGDGSSSGRPNTQGWALPYGEHQHQQRSSKMGSRSGIHGNPNV